MKGHDLTGQQFGAIYVIRRAANRNGKVYWLCRNDEGLEKEICTTNLLHQRQRSFKLPFNYVEHRSDGSSVLTLVRRNGEKLHCFVDTTDYDCVKSHRWFAHKTPASYTFYACANVLQNGKRTVIYMHRLLLPDAALVDHKDRNGLNNRRSNLRLATHAQNTHNRKKQEQATSRFQGVCKQAGKFVAQLGVKGENIRIGTFDSEIDAALSFNEAAKLHYGEFARLNEIPQVAI